MRFFYALVFTILANCLAAQIMFRDSMIHQLTTSEYTFETPQQDTLSFDFYYHQSSQPLPLIVYAHGGGFSEGDKKDDDVVAFCKQLAHCGYAVASVNYRLTMFDIGFGCDVPASDKINAINEASFDVSSAVNYILENNAIFQIDPDRVILAGDSASAEIVLNMAYVYQNDVLPNIKFAGVIGLAGAIIHLDKLDTDRAIPTLLFHGTGDRLVPYNVAPHHYCHQDAKGYLTLYGSKAIAERLKGIGSSYYLYTIVNGSHDWAKLPRTRCFDEVTDFLFNDVINIQTIRQTERIINE